VECAATGAEAIAAAAVLDPQVVVLDIQLPDFDGYEVLRLARPRYNVNTGLEAIMAAVTVMRPTHFVNFAALNVVAESWEHYADYFRTNVVGLARLHDSLRRWGKLEKYVQVSTPEVYGTTQTFLREAAPYRPSTPYAVSRAAADMYLATLHAAYAANPARFGHRRPTPPQLPTAAWINQPSREALIQNN